jgi:quercetin dioxygenase-like cupin family protein
MKAELVGRGQAVAPVAVRAIEGIPIEGEMRAKKLLHGERALLVEFQVAAGTSTPVHRHGHDSYLYVVKGRLRTTVAAERFDLRAGDAVLHPAGIEHRVEALEDSIWIEVKAPAEEAWRLPPAGG